MCFLFSSRRRHTRLQGDWSSDVCSSDLRRAGGEEERGDAEEGSLGSHFAQRLSYSSWRCIQNPLSFRPSGARSSHWYMPRSEEGRVGKEGRSRGSPYN